MTAGKRRLADEIDEASGRNMPKEDRRRTLEHLDLLEHERVEGRPGEAPGRGQAQSIDVIRHMRLQRALVSPLCAKPRVLAFNAALATANRTAFGLSAGLISDDPALWVRLKPSSAIKPFESQKLRYADIFSEISLRFEMPSLR